MRLPNLTWLDDGRDNSVNRLGVDLDLPEGTV